MVVSPAVTRRPFIAPTASAHLRSSASHSSRATRAYGSSRFSVFPLLCQSLCHVSRRSALSHFLSFVSLASFTQSGLTITRRTCGRWNSPGPYLIGIVIALGLSLVAVYFLGTYGAETQPRRLLIPLAFVLFTPAALAARRLLFGRIARLTEKKGAFLVIGSGEDAVEFYRSYRRMNERHAIRFIDPCVETDAPFSLDGPGSPAVDPHWERRINLVGSRYDAVILTRAPCELPIELTERLVDIHFNQIPVYTVEAFFEHYWRRVYLHGVTPQWLFKEGFYLTRRSATSHLKRLIDVVVSASALVILWPLLMLIAAAIRLESRGPAIFRQARVGLGASVFTMLEVSHYAPKRPKATSTRALATIASPDSVPSSARAASMNCPSFGMFSEAR